MNEGMVKAADPLARDFENEAPDGQKYADMYSRIESRIEDFCDDHDWQELSLAKIEKLLRDEFPEEVNLLFKSGGADTIIAPGIGRYKLDGYYKRLADDSLMRVRDKAASMLTAAINECKEDYVSPHHDEFFFILNAFGLSTNRLYAGFNKIKNKPPSKEI